MSKLRIGLAAGAVAIAAVGATSAVTMSNDTPVQPAPSPSAVGSGALPNKKLTPGAVDPKATKTVVCTTSTSTRRSVTDKTRAAVYHEYGLSYPPPGDPKAWEVDHLISLELGGSNSIKNLWPERGLRPNPKDKLENRMHKLVCDGTITLKQAQHEIATDWVAAYVKYYGRKP